MRRGLWLAGALAATLAATAWVAGDDTDGAAEPVASRSGSAASERSTATRPRREPVATAWPAAPGPRDRTPWPVDAARLVAWMPPPPPAAPARSPAALRAAQAAASAPPTAPPFPYPLIGRIEDGDSVHALFAAPQRTLGVRPQDVIDGQWRVEEIGPGGVTLTWLPGGVRQTLSFRPS